MNRIIIFKGNQIYKLISICFSGKFSSLYGFLILLLLKTEICFSQDFSIHRLHQEEFGSEFKIERGEFDDIPIIPLQENHKMTGEKKVFGYLPDWEYGSGTHNFIRYDLLTHIACFDFSVSSNGSVSNPSYWPWTDVINTAHNNGVKTILCLVNFNKDDIRAIITNEAVKMTLFNNLKTKIIAYQFDGVNIDFEGLYNDDKGIRINSFMSDLKQWFETEIPGLEISFAGPAVNWGNYWDLGGLAEACDYIFIMGYSFWGSWSSTSGPCSPLSGGTYNITNTILSQYGTVTSQYPGKLILGVPYYGLQWKTETQNPGSPVISYVASTRLKNSIPLAQQYGYLWSTTYKTPWYRYNNGTWNQVWFDDDSSLGLKYDLAAQKNLLGIGMWALGYDAGINDLWQTISDYLGNSVILPPDPPEWIIAEIVDNVNLKISSELSDNSKGIKIVYGTDAENLTDSLEVTGEELVIENITPSNLIFVKACSWNDFGYSDYSELLAAGMSTGEQNALLVYGFDRISGVENLKDHIKNYAPILTERGIHYSSASNEAIISGNLQSADYDNIIWILGEESTADVTLNEAEQAFLIEYLKNGGNLFITGSEIGWDLGRTNSSSLQDIFFYNNFLKAVYVTDAPLNQSSFFFETEPAIGSVFDFDNLTFGDGSNGSYTVEWPDAISPFSEASPTMIYSGVNPIPNGYAGVSFEGIFPDGNSVGKVIYLSFPFETIVSDSIKKVIMSQVFDFFDSPSYVPIGEVIPEIFSVSDNYPNPFNSNTNFVLNLTSKSEVTMKIINITGEELFQSDFGIKPPGKSILHLNLSMYKRNNFPSGIYFALFNIKTADKQMINVSKKIILLK